jgi:DNA-directed RNA polymerase specialized sigma24 family protein
LDIYGEPEKRFRREVPTDPAILDGVPPEDCSNEGVALVENMDELHNFLHGLKKETLNALVLVTVQGMGDHEAAERSGCRVIDVRRAKKALEMRINDLRSA